MKKIFFLNSTLDVGGAEKMFYEIVKRLDSSMFAKKICCLYAPGKIGEALISEGFDLSHSLMRNKYDLRVIYRLFRLLRLERPDMLCVESSSLALFYGFICARLVGISCVVTFIHNMRKPGFWERVKTDIIYRIILPRLDGIGVASKAKLDSMIREYNMDKDRVVLIHNGVDLSRFDTVRDHGELRHSLGISKNEKIVGMVGRLVNEKAYDVFLRSAKEVISAIPEVKFLIIGEGRERQRLEGLADELKIRGKVIFLGERQDTPEIIPLFDVAALSSRVESFPVVLLEYMACSRPVATTDVGGNSEIITDRETGVLSPSEDYMALARAIKGLLGDEARAKKMGQAAREMVKNKFSMRHMIEKAKDFFLESMANPVKDQAHVIMAGPSLDVKGGISGFAKYYLKADFSRKFKIIYHATTVDGNKIIKLIFYIKSIFIFIARLIMDEKIKIIHICSSSEGSFYRKAVVLLISKAFGKKAIFHIHGSRFYNRTHGLRRFFIKKALDASDSILVLSKEQISMLGNFTDNKNIKMIPNAIDPADFAAVSMAEKPRDPHILFASKLSAQKGIYGVLDIIPLVAKEIPLAKFYFAGDGDIEKIKALCVSRGIEKNVVLLGWLDKERLLEVFRAAHVFLLPSYQECFPVSILEAMAAGLPVVSTKVGGIPEMIEDGVNGFLVRPGQVRELYDRVMALLKDSSMREDMRRNNIKKAQDMFSIGRVKDMFMLEYENLAHGKRNGHGKLIWYLKRLSCMPFGEVLLRTYRLARVNIDRFSTKDVKLNDILSKHKAARNFYFNNADISRIRQELPEIFPGVEKPVISEAESTLGHNFRIFDLDLKAGEVIDWHKDFVTGRAWPLRYWADIDFRNDNDSKEVRFIWELNRHQHLTALGKAYILTGDVKYSREIKAQILSWISQNPPYIGVNWTSPLELSLRLITWSWAYKFIEPSGIFSEQERAEFLKSVYLQAEFIKGNLSRYSSANNHLIGEACSLVITGLSFPEFKNSGKWLNKGKKILFKEIIKQVFPDGVIKEQAFHYQGFVMELFLMACALLIKNDIEIPRYAMERFFSMAEFIMNLVNRNGKIPEIGDSDNGMAARLSSDKRFNLYASLLTSAGILSGRGDFKTKGLGFKEEHYLLFGMEGFKKYNSIKSVKVLLNSRLFKEGGYAVFRRPSNNCAEEILVMDCGELGYPLMAPHGHSDLLSVTLSADGADLLIDPGTYLYHTGSVWRDYFRGTSAHNTITINNENQSEMKGPFMWGRRPVARIHKWEVSDERDFINASCENAKASHKRSVCFDKKETMWRIQDFVSAKGRNTIRQYFYLSHGSIVNRLSPCMIEIESSGIFLYMLLDGKFSVEIKNGESSPIMGWSSDMFGRKINSPVVVGTAMIEGGCGFNTVLCVHRKKMPIGDIGRKLNEVIIK